MWTDPSSSELGISIGHRFTALIAAPRLWAMFMLFWVLIWSSSSVSDPMSSLPSRLPRRKQNNQIKLSGNLNWERQYLSSTSNATNSSSEMVTISGVTSFLRGLRRVLNWVLEAILMNRKIRGGVKRQVGKDCQLNTSIYNNQFSHSDPSIWYWVKNVANIEVPGPSKFWITNDKGSWFQKYAGPAIVVSLDCLYQAWPLINATIHFCYLFKPFILSILG